MKKVFFWLFTVAITASFPNLLLAQDAGNLAGTQSAAPPTVMGLFDPISTRIISDPLYLPLQGQIYGSSAYSFSRVTSNNYNFSGTRTSSSKNYANVASQTLNYGVTNDFTMRLIENYELSNARVTSTSTDAVTKRYSDGFTDPEVGATYRVLDQAQYPVDFDLSADYDPNTFTSKGASSTKDGTEASGRQEIIFGAGVGREMQAFTVQATSSAIYLGDRKYITLANQNDNNDKATWEYAFALNTQTRLTERFSINVGAAYTLANNQEADDMTTGSSWIVVPASALGLNTSLNYQFIPDRLVGSLTYTYDDYTNSKNLFANAAFDNEAEQHRANVFGARLSYLFN